MSLSESKEKADEYLSWLFRMSGVKCVPTCPFYILARDKLARVINKQVVKSRLQISEYE
jgi:hypothetical protein